MTRPEIISFDVEGTLVTTDFSYAIWFEAIPRRYAERYGMELEQARKKVFEQFEKVGDQRMEWYDIKHWFRHFDIGDHEPVLASCQHRVELFPDAMDVLSSLGKNYRLVVASGSSREFLEHLLRDVEFCFERIFSSVSDYGQLKLPDFYYKMCLELQVSPGQIVHVGDNRQFDYINAIETGITAFHLDRKSRKGDDHLVTSLSEFKDLFVQ
jgi:HAD superfamily hydrolase (TIGR01549 family)